MLIVHVPPETKVTINGLLTKSIGSERHYVTYGLRPGNTYEYKIKAEIVRGRKIVPEVQTVVLTAGARRSVAFGVSSPTSEGLARAE